MGLYVRQKFRMAGFLWPGRAGTLVHTLDYICRHPGKFRNLPIDLYTDSQLVHQLCHDLYLPHTHMQLVEQLRSYITRARTMFDLAILKVRGHAGVAGNTRADKLAFTGVTSSSMVGRHSFPPRPLLPLLFPPTSPTPLTSQDLEAQVLAAASSLQPANSEQYQKEYLSSKAKTLIKQIDNTPFQDYETVQKLRKAVRKQVRKDKRQHLCDQLLQDSKGPPSKQWATLKFVRKPYTPKTQGVLQSNGKICSKAQKAETLAKYLSDEVWGHQEVPPMDPTPLYPVADMTCAPFTEAELDAALHRMRHKKAPGPDSIPVELWKYSPRHFRLSLLAHYNHVFSQATAPNNWAPAVVIMIYKGKKKDPKSPSSYRPISLVNTVYKINAALLHQRIKDAIDDRISPYQFGFRAGRSTTSPLFIIRRLEEIHERHGISFYALFLDWAQAFDSVSHEALKTSLVRIGLPQHYVNCVMAIYANATFRVREGTTLSNSYPFKRGIRQGCPLSPYLFIIVLSVLFEDLYSSYRSLFQVLPSVLSFDKPITDIEYADDTLLVARTAQALNRLLHLLQYLALFRGLHLNPEKCQLLAINPTGSISLIDQPHFPCKCPHCQPLIGEIPPAGTLLEPVEVAKYLGSYLTTNSSAVQDVNHRYSQAGRCLKSLDAFYRHSQISYKRKLLVHAQITLAILLFGSESQTYTQSQMQRLNTIHYKALRKIFSVQSSYYHRVLSQDNAECSNEYLLKLAYEHMPQLQPPSQSIQSSRIAYLGHLLRHESQLENYFCFNMAHNYIQFPQRRVGAPRIHWTEQVMTEAYLRYHYLLQQQAPPRVYDHSHPFYSLPTRQTIANTHSDWFGNTTLYRTLQPISQDRSKWRQLVHPR